MHDVVVAHVHEDLALSKTQHEQSVAGGIVAVGAVVEGLQIESYATVGVAVMAVHLVL